MNRLHIYDKIIDMIYDYYEIVDLIDKENLIGADRTMIIDEVHRHYEVASRMTISKQPGEHYRDLLAKLISRYGH